MMVSQFELNIKALLVTHIVVIIFILKCNLLTYQCGKGYLKLGFEFRWFMMSPKHRRSWIYIKWYLSFYGICLFQAIGMQCFAGEDMKAFKIKQMSYKPHNWKDMQNILCTKALMVTVLKNG